MTQVLTAEKLAEIKNYEEQMFDYFSHYSAKLREWYANGGDKSEDYKAQYNKLTEEYHRYLKYIQRLRSITTVAYDNSYQAEFCPLQNILSYAQCQTTESANSNPAYSASAAADYTRYYQNMISYFDKLLESVQQNNPECGESSDEENRDNEEKPDKAVDCDNFERNAISEESKVSFESAIVDPCSDPNAVMKEYFDRYVKAGDWDWASWNNYLSWIARTNPQWYEIFVNLSRGLGIDWDDMYKRWASSVSGDPSCSEDVLMPHCSTGQSFTTANYFGIGTTQTTIASEQDVGNNDDGDDDDDNEYSWNYCTTCKHDFVTERAFMLHIRGVTHTQKTLQSNGITLFDSTVLEENWETKHHEWLKSQYLNELDTVVGLSGSFYCELCEVEFPSHKALGSHLNGRRHRENVFIFESTGDRSLLRGKRKTPVKVTAKIQPFLDVCTQPLIGLNYMIEYQLKELDECLYVCSLCNQWLPRKSVINHLCSIVHRKTYLNTCYLPLFRIIDRDFSDRSLQTCRLEVYARKIEDFEGRKRLVIKEYSVADLDLQSEIVHLIQEHNEARLIKEKECKKSPVSTFGHSNPSTPCSADLEEGEIREDSSDDETVIREEVGSPDSCSSFHTRYNIIIKSIDKKRNSDTDCDAGKSNKMSQLLMSIITSENTDLQPGEESVDDITITCADCEKYIQELEQEGLLQLKATNSSSKLRRDSTYTDQFTKEADWVLDKLKTLKNRQEENLRHVAADVSAAARIQATKLSHTENSSVQHYNFIHDSPYNRYYKKSRFDNSLVLPSLGSPVGPSVPTHKNYNYAIPLNTGNSNEHSANFEESSTRIALSSSAFNVILSAIDALKSSGQLPSGLNPTLKEKNIGIPQIKNFSQQVNNRDYPQYTFSGCNQTREELKEPVHSTPGPTINNSVSAANTEHVNPPYVDVSKSVCVPAPMNLKGPNNIIQSPQRGPEFHQNQIVSASFNRHIQNNLPLKSFIDQCGSQNIMHQTTSSNLTNDDKIFDAYTIFSKRCELKKAQKQSWMKTPRYFRRTMRNEVNQSSTGNSQFHSATGRRLSAIADFLGVNEPPTERKQIPLSNQSEPHPTISLPNRLFSSNTTHHSSALNISTSSQVACPPMYANQFSNHKISSFPFNLMNMPRSSPSHATPNSYSLSNLQTNTSLWPVRINPNSVVSNATQPLRFYNPSFLPIFK
ncbi:UBP1-associated proteins 1C [Schistosoma japonicum]|nr:UBP1-associated proteins 1C [Schistosoma japonicum]